MGAMLGGLQDTDTTSLMLIRADLTFRQWITVIQGVLQDDNTRITGLPPCICPLSIILSALN